MIYIYISLYISLYIIIYHNIYIYVYVGSWTLGVSPSYRFSKHHAGSRTLGPLGSQMTLGCVSRARSFVHLRTIQVSLRRIHGGPQTCPVKPVSLSLSRTPIFTYFCIHIRIPMHMQVHMCLNACIHFPTGPRYCYGGYFPKSNHNSDSSYRNLTFYYIGTLDTLGLYNLLLFRTDPN